MLGEKSYREKVQMQNKDCGCVGYVLYNKGPLYQYSSASQGRDQLSET